jgi:UDP-N-acetylmuramate: L-alanyl-gamma-D-glutamyl-meso-diaminopimelate ligase
MHQAEYAESFDAADEILLAPLGRSALAPEERLDLARLAEDLAARGKQARQVADIDEIIEQLAHGTSAGDVVAILSNGAFGGIQSRLVAALETRVSPAVDKAR